MDLDLESRLELLRDDRQRYEQVAALAQTLAEQLAQFTVTQKTLGDAFSELGLKTPPLHVSHVHAGGRDRTAVMADAGGVQVRSVTGLPLFQVEFSVNADAQKFLSKSGKTLSDAIGAFTSDMNTLINKTMEDTMINARQYQAARSVHFLFPV